VLDSGHKAQMSVSVSPPWGSRAGVKVMITNFYDFSHFSAKTLSFFLKTYAMIQFLHNLALFRFKNANFFAENIFKIITSVPGKVG
jgi:hypothetical protein